MLFSYSSALTSETESTSEGFSCPSRGCERDTANRSCRQKIRSELDKPVGMFSCFGTLSGRWRGTFVYFAYCFPINGYPIYLTSLHSLSSCLKYFTSLLIWELFHKHSWGISTCCSLQRTQYNSQGARTAPLPLFSLSKLAQLCAFTGNVVNSPDSICHMFSCFIPSLVLTAFVIWVMHSSHCPAEVINSFNIELSSQLW